MQQNRLHHQTYGGDHAEEGDGPANDESNRSHVIHVLLRVDGHAVFGGHG